MVALDNDQAKFLTMLLVEDRSGVRGAIQRSLSPHGQGILSGLIDLLAGEVLGVGPMAPDDADPWDNSEEYLMEIE